MVLKDQTKQGHTAASSAEVIGNLVEGSLQHLAQGCAVIDRMPELGSAARR